MAYLHKEKETVEIDHPITEVWTAIAKAVDNLEWKIEDNNEADHQLKTKTKASFMSYASVLTINAIAVNQNTTKVAISAETPVTTITGIVDFGKTSERTHSFLVALVKQLKSVSIKSEN